MELGLSRELRFGLNCEKKQEKKWLFLESTQARTMEGATIYGRMDRTRGPWVGCHDGIE
jgi:hypothetical protein